MRETHPASGIWRVSQRELFVSFSTAFLNRHVHIRFHLHVIHASSLRSNCCLILKHRIKGDRTSEKRGSPLTLSFHKVPPSPLLSLAPRQVADNNRNVHSACRRCRRCRADVIVHKLAINAESAKARGRDRKDREREGGRDSRFGARQKPGRSGQGVKSVA